ncbi:MAG: proline dehydrogenase family protein, partial [Dehalococcoidia bacterium]|nr:proline dehydrogenase family protein [Dehalococcoidia bacterium]
MKLLYPFAKRYIAGHDFRSAQFTAKELSDNGFALSFNYVGEYSKTLDEAIAARNQYSEILNYYQDEKIDLSIKLSQVGLLISPEDCEGLLQQIVEKAHNYGHTIRFDMEHSIITDKTLDLCLKLNQKYPATLGVALQARLFRTKDDMKELMNNNISVRLVKGAYIEKESIALKSYQEIQENYLSLIKLLGTKIDRRCAVATHDETILDDILSKPDADRFDYEFIYGIRRDLQQKLKDQGHKVRI